jgi:hypothetical protein
MADDDSLFLAVDESASEAGGWFAEALGLEPVRGDTDAASVAQFRRPARTADGWVGFLVQVNKYAELDPEPDEVQAIDGYKLYVDIWYGGGKSAVQQAEARQAFEDLVNAQPDVAALLCHNMSALVAAHLPSAGTKYSEDIEAWAPWVVR